MHDRQLKSIDDNKQCFKNQTGSTGPTTDWIDRFDCRSVKVPVRFSQLNRGRTV